jgi:hypothetical protein
MSELSPEAQERIDAAAEEAAAQRTEIEEAAADLEAQAAKLRDAGEGDE